jgi:hypothetical protein
VDAEMLPFRKKKLKIPSVLKLHGALLVLFWCKQNNCPWQVVEGLAGVRPPPVVFLFLEMRPPPAGQEVNTTRLLEPAPQQFLMSKQFQ